MNLYLAAIYTSNLHLSSSFFARMTPEEKAQRLSVDNLLESYHYLHQQIKVDRVREDGVQVFLDSGAFSAFTKGVRIDLPKYCDYIKRNEDIIKKEDGVLLASVLDGIGDVHLTYENQLAMEAHGVRPLPCFHYGEDERYLEWYIANYEYITLGGMVPIETKDLIIWLDRMWDKYLTDGSGNARLKVHGFGVTTVSIMKRYPWHSVDSSSWVQAARTGNVLLLPEARALAVSNESPARKIQGQHIDNLAPVQREALEQRLRSCGVDTDRMRETYISRWAYNIWAYAELGRTHVKHGFQFARDQMELY